MRKAWHVTLPAISPVIFFNLVMAIIGSLQIFAAPLIVTGGGPDQSTYFYTQHIYDNTFLKMLCAPSQSDWSLGMVKFSHEPFT